MVAHPRKGETYAGLAAGFDIDTTTVFRRERGHVPVRQTAPADYFRD